MYLSNSSLNTINVDDPLAMRDWTVQLRMSETQLRATNTAAGNHLAAVCQRVGKLSPPRGRAGRLRQ